MELFWAHENLILNINLSWHIMPYFGYMNDWAELYKRLWRRTKDFWDSNIEIISWTILKEENDKLFLHILDNFWLK